MVIGTDVENGVVLAVVPSDELVVRLCEREEVVAALSHLLPLLHLCKEPAATDDRRGFEELQ